MSDQDTSRDGVAQTRWESVVDQAIRKARERGEFDGLPGIGQPLPNDENPFAGEWELGFRAMKNAGVVPPWMELGREVHEGLVGLAKMREQAGWYGRERVSRVSSGKEVSGETGGTGRASHGRRSGWKRWWRRAPDRTAEEQGPAVSDQARLEAERGRARARYLERAAAVDKKIAAYNAALPNDLWRLRRGMVTAEEAGREFDAAWPESRDED